VIRPLLEPRPDLPPLRVQLLRLRGPPGRGHLPRLRAAVRGRYRNRHDDALRRKQKPGITHPIGV
jgi:hypothetical protein